jgi:hypothetical protein
VCKDYLKEEIEKNKELEKELENYKLKLDHSKNLINEKVTI